VPASSNATVLHPCVFHPRDRDIPTPFAEANIDNLTEEQVVGADINNLGYTALEPSHRFVEDRNARQPGPNRPAIEHLPIPLGWR
jgi:hypothetical protein